MADGYMPQPDSGDNCCDCPDRTSPCDDCGGGVCCVCGTCSITTEADCAAAGGTFLPDVANCDSNPCEPTCCLTTPFEDGLGGFWTTFYRDCAGVAHYSGPTTFDALYRTSTQTYGIKCDPGCVETGTVFTCFDSSFYNGTFCDVFSSPACDYVCTNETLSVLSDLCNCPAEIAESVSLKQKALNLTSASGRIIKAVAKNQQVLVSNEEQERRQSICNGCEFFNGSSCAKCGCMIRFKSRLQTEHCPINKW